MATTLELQTRGEDAVCVGGRDQPHHEERVKVGNLAHMHEHTSSENDSELQKV